LGSALFSLKDRSSQFNLILGIQIQNIDRGSAYGRLTENANTLKFEMIVPLILSWVK
jgi:hypothetical protein